MDWFSIIVLTVWLSIFIAIIAFGYSIYKIAIGD